VERADAAEEDGAEWRGEVGEDRSLVEGRGGLAPGGVVLSCTELMRYCKINVKNNVVNARRNALEEMDSYAFLIRP
jgi:hypothetical protein